MSESLFMVSPNAFTAYQVCTCEDSRMVDDMSIENGKLEGDKWTATMVSRPFVCSVCKTPYRVMCDTRKVAMVTNIGE